MSHKKKTGDNDSFGTDDSAVYWHDVIRAVNPSDTVNPADDGIVESTDGMKVSLKRVVAAVKALARFDVVGLEELASSGALQKLFPFTMRPTDGNEEISLGSWDDLMKKREDDRRELDELKARGAINRSP